MVKNFIDSPLPFNGSVESKKANNTTHKWTSSEDRVICLRCDCTYGGVYSEWPCGYPVPRTGDLK